MIDPTRAVRERFAQRLKTLRVPRGFKTARSFAHALGIDENRYTRYERAEVEPDLSLIDRICETLHITPNDLLISHRSVDTRYSPGFAEPADSWVADPDPSSTRSAAGRSGSPRSVAPQPSKREAQATKRRAVAWKLAAHLASLSAGQSPAPLALTSKYFAEIEADPFSFATKLPADVAHSKLDAAEQQRIAIMVEAVISAVEDSLAT